MELVKEEQTDDTPSTSGSSKLKSSPQNSESDCSDNDDYSFIHENALTENITENYEDELDNDLSRNKDRQDKLARSKGTRKMKSKIPPYLKGLMGEANLRFARGEYDIAEKMCFELIRQAPLAYEPYWTLSQLYENDAAKSVQYLTIAAHLNPTDVTHWSRLAQIHIDANNLRRAVTCLTRAIYADPSNIEFQLKRIELLEKLRDTKYIRKCKIKLVQVLDASESDMILKLCKELAEELHQSEEHEKAVDVFTTAFEKCPKEITPEIVNIYLELLLITKNYAKCLDIFVQYCNIEIEIILGMDNKISVLSFNMPENIPIDLRIKFIICVIRLEAFDLLNSLLEPLLLEENVEHIGDLYLDVAENLMAVSRHADALKLLVPLIKSDKFSLAAVWLKYAECLQGCGMTDQAIDSYFSVVKMAPQHTEVRYPLSELLLEKERIPEALEILSQDYTSNELDVGLLIKKMDLQKRIEDFDNYFKSAEILLLRHCIEIKTHNEIKIVGFLDRSDKIPRLIKVRSLRGETYTPNEVVSVREPPVEEEFKLFRECLNICFERKEYALLQKFVFTALSSTKFYRNYQKELMVLALFACIYNNDNEHGYYIVRDYIMKSSKLSHLHWNLWNLMLQSMEEARHARFIVRQGRLLGKTEARILAANNALCAGSYKIAIMSLMPLLKENPTPFLSFLMGVVFLKLSQQKIGIRKKFLTPIVYSLFLHYAKNRGQDAYQEINYNLGRMYHKYGIMHIAAYYYNLVLEFEHPLINKHGNMLSLRKEAAFNLFLIYKESKNHIGCKNLLLKYLTI